MYEVALIIHLLCAIIFIGFIFADVVVFKGLDEKYSKEESRQIKETIYKRGVKIYPFSLLLLFLTGGFMFSKYVNSDMGYFTTPLQQLLWLKLSLVMLIIFGVLYALLCRVRGVKSAAFMEYFHTIALVLGVLIVVIAKLMFFV